MSNGRGRALSLGSWRIERRPEPRRIPAYRLGAVLIGLAIGLILAPIISGVPAGIFYETAWRGTIGSPLGLSNLLAVGTPLVIAGLAAAIPLRLGLWNIGIDGQILMGAWFASAAAFSLESLSGPVLIPIMFIVAMIGGALWMLVPALARAYLGVSEFLTTFLLNFVASAWLIYWVTGPWKGASAAGGGIRSKTLPTQSNLALLNLDGTVIHWGVILAVVLPVLLWLLMRFTRLGFEMNLTGAGERVGRFAGLDVRRKQVIALLIGGGLAGLAGAVNMMGTIHQYSEGLTNNTGFEAVVIAVLAGSSPLGVLMMGAVYAFLLAGSNAVSIAGVSSELVYGIIGISLLAGAIGESVARLQVVRTVVEERPAPAAEKPSKVAI